MTEAGSLMIDIAEIMSDIGSASRGEWTVFSDASKDYWNFETIFREMQHLNEKL